MTDKPDSFAVIRVSYPEADIFAFHPGPDLPTPELQDEFDQLVANGLFEVKQEDGKAVYRPTLRGLLRIIEDYANAGDYESAHTASAHLHHMTFKLMGEQQW